MRLKTAEQAESLVDRGTTINRLTTSHHNESTMVGVQISPLANFNN